MLLESSKYREPFVVIGRAALVFSRRRQMCQILRMSQMLRSHGTGRHVPDRLNRQISEVARIVGQENPRNSRHVGAEEPRQLSVGCIDGECAEADTPGKILETSPGSDG